MMVNGALCDNYLDSSDNYSNGYNGYSNGSIGKGYATILASSSSVDSSPVISNCSPSSYSGSGYIEHRVSKMDTLAGVAIKYGVEVADVRRMNGLATDLQMFALDTLRIPLPGRHPPSPILSNGTTDNGGHQMSSRRSEDDILDSLQSLKLKPPRRVSPAMSNLQGYYNLKTPPRPKNFKLIGETELSTYRSSRGLSFEDTKDSPFSDSALNKHRKSRSLVSLENIQQNGDANDTDSSVRRRQKSDAIDSSTPEILIKDGSNERGFLGRIGKGLQLRPKVGGRNESDTANKQYSGSSQIGDFFNDVFVAIRKSSSTSNLDESENNGGSLFVWPTSKWSLKADVISRPIFDGLPKPVSGRKNKAALD